MTLACASCRNRKKGGGDFLERFGVFDLDKCGITHRFLDIHHSHVVAPENCAEYVEYVSYRRKLMACLFWFRKKTVPSHENKSDPRNIAAEMIALDMIKNKIYPEIKQTPSPKIQYEFLRILSFANDKKFSFKIINDVPYKITNRVSLFKVDEYEFHKNNGFELTSYGEKILIEAAKKLIKMKEEEDKVKAEFDAQQKAIDFIEKRLGLNTPVSSAG